MDSISNDERAAQALRALMRIAAWAEAEDRNPDIAKLLRQAVCLLKEEEPDEATHEL